MEIPASRWHAAVARRRSRRRFNSAELEPDVEAHVRSVCEGFRPFPEARAELIPGSPDKIFKGAIGPYGKIKGAPAAIAFVGDMTDPHIQEKVGYMGEGIILEATAMDLATCWVGGFFRPKAVASFIRIEANEKVLAVTPVGHAVDGLATEEKIMTGFGRNHRRKPLADMVTGVAVSALDGWKKAALEAARIAPSAVNRQPWRFHLDRDCITVSSAGSRIEFGVSTRLDCGIAMLHVEVAALDCGVKGEWQLLTKPDVARFTVAGGT
jgi:hypothetical protein